jgi:hypothetical protein
MRIRQAFSNIHLLSLLFFIIKALSPSESDYEFQCRFGSERKLIFLAAAVESWTINQSTKSVPPVAASYMNMKAILSAV